MIDYEKLKESIADQIAKTKDPNTLSTLTLCLSTLVRTQESDILLAREFLKEKK